MRNTHLLEQFMEENGIKYDEPFTVEFEDRGEVKTLEFKLIKNVLWSRSDILLAVVKYHQTPDKLLISKKWTFGKLLFSDNVKIVKKPWKPEDGERYWYVRFDGNNNSIIDSSCWDQHSFDFTKYIIGNCFKTKKEAEEHQDDIFKILKGEPLVKWEK